VVLIGRAVYPSDYGSHHDPLRGGRDVTEARPDVDLLHALSEGGTGHSDEQPRSRDHRDGERSDCAHPHPPLLEP